MAQPLDPSFGTGGIVTTHIGDPTKTSDARVCALALLGDGKIAAAGMTAPGLFLKTDFALAHYNADGSPDTSFSPIGHITRAFGGEFDFVKASAFQRDGTIVATGNSREGNLLTASYNADGSPKLTFGTGGQVSTRFDGNGVSANAVAVHQDEKIVVVGNVAAPGVPILVVVRYNADGSLDSGFGNAGHVSTAFGGFTDCANAVAIDADGRIVVAGKLGTGINARFALIRYQANGSLDTSFGTSGTVTTAFGSGGEGIGTAYAIAIQPDHKIVAAGIRESFPAEFALARYNPDGSLDATFGTGGTVSTVFGQLSSRINALAIQSDGKIVAVGVAVTDSGDPDEIEVSELAIARYTSDGKLDSTFGSGGQTQTDLHGASGYAVAIQPDGKIVAAGSAGDVSGVPFKGFALARYCG